MEISEFGKLIFGDLPEELELSLMQHINEDMQYYSTVSKLLSEVLSLIDLLE